MLIYFIHYTAVSIQLPEVIASIARDLTRAIDVEAAGSARHDELVNGRRRVGPQHLPPGPLWPDTPHYRTGQLRAAGGAVVREGPPGGRGMPAVPIRQLETLAKIMAAAPAGRTRVLLDQAAMIQRVSLLTVPEEADRADVTARYEAVLAVRVAEEPPEADGTGGGFLRAEPG